MKNVISLLLAVLLASACTNKESNKVIKLAYLPITHSISVLNLAQMNPNIELVKFGSWPELTDALNAGQVDGAVVLIELAMKSKQEGAKIKAVSLAHKDGNVIVVAKDINSVADLKGKTFAIPHRQSSHNILLHEALKRGGLTVDDIVIRELGPTEMPSALASGQISGFCVAEPFGAMAVKIGSGKVLYTSEELWENSLCCAFVLNDEFINGRPKEAKQLVAEFKKEANKIVYEKALTLAKGKFKQTEDVLSLSLKWIKFNDLEITPGLYKVLSSKVKDYGLSDTPPAYEDFVWSGK